MHVVIIEGDKKIAENIRSLILKIDPAIHIVSVLETLEESVAFFRTNKKLIDLVFSDINLSDGVSFSIFNQVRLAIPVIFITQYDEFIMSALEHNGIDYILKPPGEEDISRALNKYKKLQKHFLNNNTIINFLEYLTATRKTRFIVKWGTDNIAMPVLDIALFYTKNKVVYTIDKTGKKFIIDKTMSQLENELDKKTFFRANRQYIININYIKGFSTYERVKLEVELLLPDFTDVIIISQDTAPTFKSWIVQGW
jgi:DNA-binding LytR/AlgR family response regulator